MGQFPQLTLNHYKFSVNLLSHVADLVRFLDHSLIWNTIHVFALESSLIQ